MALPKRQSSAELALEDKNEASFFMHYKWIIIGCLLAFVVQVVAIVWFIKYRRLKKARQADAEIAELAKTVSSAGSNGGGVAAGGNVWGVPSGGNVWSMGGLRNPVVRQESRYGDGVLDVPPAYDGRRDVETIGGKI